QIRTSLLHEQERLLVPSEQDVSPQLGEIRNFVALVHNLAKKCVKTKKPIRPATTGVHEMWPLILAAIGLWLIVYCLIVAQRCLTHECECNNTPSGAVAERKRFLANQNEKVLFAHLL
ncbi:hypothetical protein GCK32_011440, partial [Trichostrongylus colubriformis]